MNRNMLSTCFHFLTVQDSNNIEFKTDRLINQIIYSAGDDQIHWLSERLILQTTYSTALTQRDIRLVTLTVYSYLYEAQLLDALRSTLYKILSDLSSYLLGSATEIFSKTNLKSSRTNKNGL